MKKPVVKLNPQESDGVTRRGRDTRDREHNVFLTDGIHVMLKEPMECGGCHSLHYWFVSTFLGHRCIPCVGTFTTSRQLSPSRNGRHEAR